MRILSKSKIMSYRQCPKRLWLEIHQRDLDETSQETSLTFFNGNQVGAVARQVYDPKNKGIEFHPMTEGVNQVIEQT